MPPEHGKIYAGVDAGSRMTKVVLWDADRQALLATRVAEQTADQRASVQGLLDAVLQDQGLRPDAVTRLVATGYGRNLVDPAATTVTEITCHARGVRCWHPEARSIIEIGGQDSKVIRLDDDGRVRDFQMNDRCAAGTGRFLEMVAARVALPLGELGTLARQSLSPALISSMCVVFAETEIVGLLASGRPAPDVVAGVQAAMAVRIGAMAGRRLEGPVLFTGGVALIPGMAEALQEVLACPVTVTRQPMLTGALGAALIAGTN